MRGENSAILSTDISSLQSYKKRKSQYTEMQTAILDINNLKDELREIKSMIKTLIVGNASHG